MDESLQGKVIEIKNTSVKNNDKVDKVNNDNIVNLLQYCDLIEELKKVNVK